VRRTHAPQLYRVLVPAKDLEQSRRFYESLFVTPGRPVGGGRIYFDCGPVLLGILDYAASGEAHFPPPAEALYFATGDLEGMHRRARKLDCLSAGLLHDDPTSPLGEIVVRPWGERSFYAQDPSGNPLCFVDKRTVFTGTARQLEALARRMNAGPPTRAAPSKMRGSIRAARRGARAK
jgi:catechol 2,3-dioxygenase-like lactoylglutathione lyase family enzyme